MGTSNGNIIPAGEGVLFIIHYSKTTFYDDTYLSITNPAICIKSYSSFNDVLNEPIEFSFDDCISVSPLIVGTNDVISIENSSDYATIDRLSIYAEAKFDNDEPTAVSATNSKIKITNSNLLSYSYDIFNSRTYGIKLNNCESAIFYGDSIFSDYNRVNNTGHSEGTWEPHMEYFLLIVKFLHQIILLEVEINTVKALEFRTFQMIAMVYTIKAENSL